MSSTSSVACHLEVLKLLIPTNERPETVHHSPESSCLPSPSPRHPWLLRLPIRLTSTPLAPLSLPLPPCPSNIPSSSSSSSTSSLFTFSNPFTSTSPLKHNLALYHCFHKLRLRGRSVLNILSRSVESPFDMKSAMIPYLCNIAPVPHYCLIRGGGCVDIKMGCVYVVKRGVYLLPPLFFRLGYKSGEWRGLLLDLQKVDI